MRSTLLTHTKLELLATTKRAPDVASWLFRGMTRNTRQKQDVGEAASPRRLQGRAGEANHEPTLSPSAKGRTLMSENLLHPLGCFHSVARGLSQSPPRKLTAIDLQHGPRPASCRLVGCVAASAAGRTTKKHDFPIRAAAPNWQEIKKLEFGLVNPCLATFLTGQNSVWLRSASMASQLKA